MVSKEQNLINDWIESDFELSKVLVKIQNLGLDIEEQAEIAFHEVSDMYGVPKMPDDILYDEYTEEDLDYEPSSVYEELGIAKYLYPDEDPRGRVLSAIYAVLNKAHIDRNELFNKIQDNVFGIGFLGEFSRVELILIKKGENWQEKECKLFMRFC